jgi:integrase
VSNRSSQRTPSYRRHNPSGQAVVTFAGRDHYLGRYGSEESRTEYDRLIAEWLANGRHNGQRHDPATHLSVNELILAYWHQVEEYYRSPDGKPTNEVRNIQLALRPLKQLYGHALTADFDSLALEAVRAQMIRDGRCRSRVNKDASRIKRMFRWAAAKRLVPVAVCQLLDTVEGLRRGRSEARETEPVKPVPEACVEATLPFLQPQPAAMARLQLLTGMRPGEVVLMRGIDLDMSGKVWLYRPGSDQGPHGRHKNAYRGQQRVVPIGPRAQEVLKPWLRLNLHEYLFSPAEAEAKRRAARRKRGIPGQQVRCPKRKPKKAPGSRYTTNSYSQAVRIAAQKADTAGRAKAIAAGMPADQALETEFVPHWHPNQLRHTKATEIRREAGLDAARAVLGHRSPQITEVYAELDTTRAAEVMERLG